MVTTKTKTKEKFVQFHITIPISDLEKWRAFKKSKYNGLKAMSMMVRNFVNEGIAREQKGQK